jgi:hypothetical protein
LSGFVTALLTAATLFGLAGYQVTSEEAATRLLGRLAAALIEIDLWLPEHRDDLELLARDRPASVVAVRDIPVAATIPADAVVGSDDRALRATLVRSMGESLYEQGTSALRDGQDNPRKPALTDPLRWGVILLERDSHGFWQAALPLCLLLLVASCAIGLLFGSSPLGALSVGAVASTVLSGAVWLMTFAAEGASNSPVDVEIMLAVRDGAWIGLRNAMAVSVVMISARVLTSSLRRERPRAIEYWDLPEEADADRP